MNQVQAEVRAARQAVGVLTKFPRALLSVQGADRVKFLHNVVTHDIKGLPLGQGRPACLLDRQGKIRAAFLVHAQSDALVLEMDPLHLQAALQGLQQYLLTEAVELKEVTSHYRIMALHGPLAQELLSNLWPDTVLACVPLSHGKGPQGTGVHWIVRWDLLRVPGYHLWVDPESEKEILEKLLRQGEATGLKPLTQEAFEVLRIEAGVPWPGKEIDETVILNELGTEEMVSYTKGCFVGQEIVARIKYRAHPPRQLMGFLMGATEVPSPRSPIESESKEVGVITSACFSVTLNRVIALGFLKVGVSATDLLVRSLRGSLQATVTPLPFVS